MVSPSTGPGQPTWPSRRALRCPTPRLLSRLPGVGESSANSSNGRGETSFRARRGRKTFSPGEVGLRAGLLAGRPPRTVYGNHPEPASACSSSTVVQVRAVIRSPTARCTSARVRQARTPSGTRRTRRGNRDRRRGADPGAPRPGRNPSRNGHVYLATESAQRSFSARLGSRLEPDAVFARGLAERVPGREASAGSLSLIVAMGSAGGPSRTAARRSSSCPRRSNAFATRANAPAAISSRLVPTGRSSSAAGGSRGGGAPAQPARMTNAE